MSVDATNWSRYSSGIFNNCQKNLNHAAALVGINGGNWVVKNSWGLPGGNRVIFDWKKEALVAFVSQRLDLKLAMRTMMCNNDVLIDIILL